MSGEKYLRSSRSRSDGGSDMSETSSGSGGLQLLDGESVTCVNNSMNAESDMLCRNLTAGTVEGISGGSELRGQNPALGLAMSSCTPAE